MIKWRRTRLPTLGEVGVVTTLSAVLGLFFCVSLCPVIHDREGLNTYAPPSANGVVHRAVWRGSRQLIDFPYIPYPTRDVFRMPSNGKLHGKKYA